MEKDKGTTNLAKLVDDILKDNGDIISLRTKLNAIANARANNKLNKNSQDLERYQTIVDYFFEKDDEGKYINKDRIPQNRNYLVDVMHNLTKYLSTQEDMSLSIQMKDILAEIKDYKFKSGTKIEPGVFI